MKRNSPLRMASVGDCRASVGGLGSRAHSLVRWAKTGRVPPESAPYCSASEKPATTSAPVDVTVPRTAIVAALLSSWVPRSMSPVDTGPVPIWVQLSLESMAYTVSVSGAGDCVSTSVSSPVTICSVPLSFELQATTVTMAGSRKRRTAVFLARSRGSRPLRSRR